MNILIHSINLMKNNFHELNNKGIPDKYRDPQKVCNRFNANNLCE